MHKYGNIEEVKQALREKFQKKEEMVKAEFEKKIAEIKTRALQRINELRQREETRTEAEVEKLKSRIVSEKRLEAKRNFEERREKLIEEVFQAAFYMAMKKAHSKLYLDFIGNKLPKGEIFADSDYYKLDAKINKHIIGVQVKADNVLYDFSLDGAIEANRDRLRDIISKELFG